MERETMVILFLMVKGFKDKSLSTLCQLKLVTSIPPCHLNGKSISLRFDN